MNSYQNLIIFIIGQKKPQKECRLYKLLKLIVFMYELHTKNNVYT